jgi:hypothetical protein
MKTKFKFSMICLMAIASVFISACDKDDEGDTVKPVINLIEPEDGDILEIGDEHGVHLDMELSDNEMLKSYKIDIHSNFDGHAHTRAAAETVDFAFSKSWDVSGKNVSVHHHEIKIPANATPGDYHLMVYCTDAVGNESYVARNVVLSTEGGEHHHDE